MYGIGSRVYVSSSRSDKLRSSVADRVSPLHSIHSYIQFVSSVLFTDVSQESPRISVSRHGIYDFGVPER